MAAVGIGKLSKISSNNEIGSRVTSLVVTGLLGFIAFVPGVLFRSREIIKRAINGGFYDWLKLCYNCN